jgi:cytochrome c peroxidase
MLAACSAESPSKEQLGKELFLDQGLSQPGGQACADCHAPTAAFRDPESDHTTSMGVVTGRFGTRNAPTAMYAASIPPLHYEGRWIGGQFWDGRADTLDAQAAGPLLNPREMNNPDRASVVAKVRAAPYAATFRELYGTHALDDVDQAFAHITDAIASYERGPELSPFNSRYDRYIAGSGSLTAQELRGYQVFNANCASCHPAPLFTDFSYANVGVPRYDNSMALTADPSFVDHGLATTVMSDREDGTFRVPTLRNITRTAPYGHNGYFENLPYMLEFLNTRDVGSVDVSTCSRSPGSKARCAWPAPEIPSTITRQVGNLGLTSGDLEDLAAFLDTLSDDPH